MTDDITKRVELRAAILAMLEFEKGFFRPTEICRALMKDYRFRGWISVMLVAAQTTKLYKSGDIKRASVSWGPVTFLSWAGGKEYRRSGYCYGPKGMKWPEVRRFRQISIMDNHPPLPATLWSFA